MPEPIRQSLLDHDLTPRFFKTSTVVASPTDNTETIIASLTVGGFGDTSVVSGIELVGFAAYTVGTSGDGVNLKIHQTNAAGSTIAATGLVTSVATNLGALSVRGFDTGAGVATYVLTMTVHAGAAASTVSAVYLRALVV